MTLGCLENTLVGAGFMPARGPIGRNGHGNAIGRGTGVRSGLCVGILVALLGLGWLLPPRSWAATGNDALPRIGPAPEFALTTQDGRRLSLGELRGKVVALTFIYATCADTCPMLTAKMARIQDRLGADFGSKVYFLSVTVDPDRDTPAVLARYAKLHHVNPAGWAFLTGTSAEIREVARRYGIFYKRTRRGDVEHTFLTSLVDQEGTLRVQYMGVRFNPEEMLGDLQSLLKERSP